MAINIDMKNMTPIAQENTAACWLACYQMMYMWKGRERKSLEPTIRKAIGSGTFDDAYDNGLDKAHWPQISRALNLWPVEAHEMTMYELQWRLESFGPLLVYEDWGLGLHVIVVTGADEDYNSFTYKNHYVQVAGEKPRKRTSDFSYLRRGVKNLAPAQAAIQHWTEGV